MVKETSCYIIICYQIVQGNGRNLPMKLELA